MRVLALTEESDRSETALLVGLKNAGIEIMVAGSPTAERASELDGAKIPINLLRCKSKIDFTAMRTLRSILRQSPYDIVHAFTARMLSNVLFASLGLPIKVVAYRGTTGHVSRIDPTSWVTFLNPRVSAISCVSKAVRSYLETCGVPSKKLFVIYKGHEIDWYSHGQAVNLAEFGIPPEASVISCVANIRPVKGVDILIQSFRELLSRAALSRQLHLLVIGEMRDPSIQELGHGADSNIHFLGYHPDASRIISASTIYVQPSRAREGLPKAVIEAMSQGLAVVVSDAGGLPELVRHEIDGLVCPAGQSAPLLQVIARLLADEDLRKRLGKSARNRIQSDFSVQKTVDATLAMYRDIQ